MDTVAHQRVQSLYGPRKPPPNALPDSRLLSAITDEESYVPSGIAARIGGRLTVDDSFAAESSGSRRHSFQHLGDEDFAPEQFLNRSSPRNLSVRGSIRSHRSNRANEDPFGAQQRPSILNQRRTDVGTTSVMQKTVMEMPGDKTMSPHQNRSLPVPELKYTDTGTPYYASTPNPAVLTPLHVNQIGTPEYMQQVADKLSVQQTSTRPGQYGQRLVDTGTSTQQYQSYSRAAPVPQIPVNRRSTLPSALTPEPVIQLVVPPKPPRTPQSQLTSIQENRNGSAGSSLNTKGVPTNSSISAIPTKVSMGTLPRQPSQDVPSSLSSQNPINTSRGTLSHRNPALGKTPKLGSINMGGSIRVSMPDIFAAATVEAPPPLSREEVSRLSSERREAVRRLRDEEERMKRNPLLFIFHPAVRVRTPTSLIWVFKKRD